MGLVEVLRKQFANEGHVTPSMLAKARLGKGTQAEQIRALTDLLKINVTYVSKLAKR